MRIGVPARLQWNARRGILHCSGHLRGPAAIAAQHGREAVRCRSIAGMRCGRWRHWPGCWASACSCSSRRCGPPAARCACRAARRGCSACAAPRRRADGRCAGRASLAGAGVARLRMDRLARRRAAGRPLPAGARRPRPGRSAASSPGCRAGRCRARASSSRSSRRDLQTGKPVRCRARFARLVPRLRRRCADRQPAAAAARRPALAADGAAAAAARHAEPAWLRPRAVAVRTRHRRQRQRARHGRAQTAAPLSDGAGAPDRARPPATCATRSGCGCRMPPRPVCWRRWRSATRRRSTRDDWELFRHTGVAHLMSISGLHVTMFAWLAGGLVAALWRLQCAADAVAARRRWRRAGAAWPRRRAMRCWPAGACRRSAPCWMLATVGAAAQVGRALAAAAGAAGGRGGGQRDRPVGAAAAGLLVVVRRGGAADRLAAGAACPALRPAPGWWPALRRGLRAGLRTQVVASVGLAPLTLVFFQQLSLVGFVANLLAIPLVTLLITPLALLACRAAAAVAAGGGAGAGADRGPGLAGPLAAGHWTRRCRAVVGLRPAGCWAGRCWCCRCRGACARWACRCCCRCCGRRSQRPAEGEFEVVVADVGQGTRGAGAHARPPAGVRHRPALLARHDAGARVLLPLLRARGETPDRPADAQPPRQRPCRRCRSRCWRACRCARCQQLAARRAPAAGAACRAERCEAGQRWHWDGVHFEVLHPLAERLRAAAQAQRAELRAARTVADAGRSLLLTGDIEAAQEAALAARRRADLRSDVLLVPHHGSSTSSTARFRARRRAAHRGGAGRLPQPLRPPGAGRGGALPRAGSRVLRSDRCGAWTWLGAVRRPLRARVAPVTGIIGPASSRSKPS